MPSDPRTSAAQAEDLSDLLNHIAWTDCIKPRLDKLKQDLSSQLSQALLRADSDRRGPSALQLAARIEGIDFISSLFRSILREGDSAIRLLENTTWTITPSNSTQ